MKEDNVLIHVQWIILGLYALVGVNAYLGGDYHLALGMTVAIIVTEVTMIIAIHDVRTNGGEG